MAVGLRCTLAAQGEDGRAAKLASLGSRRGLHRSKLGGGQRRFLRSRRSANARWCLRCVGGSALARESAAMSGHWQQQMGVGTSLRRAADASARAARSRPGVEVGGGSGACFARHTPRVAQGKVGGGAAVHASLASLGLLSSAMVGC